jgi:ATP-dependent helicase/nuclease subunit B
MRYSFLDHLDHDTLVLTAGQRLSRALEEAHARRQRARGLQVWERPAILPWTAWLQTGWEASLETVNSAQRILLAPAQERTLWERVIEESEHAHALLQVAATARVAQEAWRLLHERRLPHAAMADPRRML